ncbi:MAG: PPC domain-containing protein [Anaerolineae bacterium]|nr:PPC domain-containing protein [Anaerolineae bacterium]
MKRQSVLLTLTLVLMLISGLAGPVQAQSLDQTFEWAEVGLSISYPAGWMEANMDSETYVLYSDPTYDIQNSNEPPEAPAVLILALPAEMAELMGGREALLSGFGSEFGVGDETFQETTVAGYDALRVQTSADAYLYANLVVIQRDTYFYVVMGISAADQAFTPLFNSMLDTLVIGEPGSAQGGASTTLQQGAGEGLEQSFVWPETGLALNYPAGWAEEIMDSETRVLLSDPAVDPFSDEPPDSPAVLIMAMPAEMAAMMGGSEGLLEGFGSEFGVSAEAQQQVTIAGQAALRVQSPPEADTYADVVVINSSDFVFLLMGISASDQAFTSLYDSILATVTLGASAAAPDGPGTMPEPAVTEALPLVNGVRIRLDQTLTGSWNEIDAVELVGLDAGGTEIGQWATMVEASSQYADDSWAAEQVLGEPDTFECGDIPTAWASSSLTGRETLTVFYDTEVQPTAVSIYETYNPGAITEVAVLPADGSDPIVIFEGVDPTTDCPGVFSIAVELPSGDSNTISETITSNLDNATYRESWAFDGAAGDVVTITMVATSGNLDTLLYLMDSAGNVLASNDDATNEAIGPYNSQIANFTLPAAGTYTIEATRFGEENGGTTGSYELTIDTLSGSAPAPAVTTGESVISYGQTVSGAITEGTTREDWTFTGAAGDIVTITMAADGLVSLDAFVQLLDSSGAELAANDDANSDTLGMFDSQIVGYTLPSSGQYIIRASRISGTGAYQLTLESGATAAADTIAYGETVTGTLTDTDYRTLWAFEGTQGDVVTITMVDVSTSQALDSYLILLDPDGTEIASNDDAADTSIGAFNAQIANAPLPATGTYTIVATRFGEQFGNGAGAYELSLRQGK